MPRSRRRRQRSYIVWFISIILTAVALLLLLNWIVMPLVVGRGRETVVPVLVGMDRFTAEEAVFRAGLVLGEVRSVPHPSVPADRVISQQPAAGRHVKRGRAVQLDVSKGAGRARVPHTEGLNVQRATELLSQHGLVVDGVESLRVPNVPVGQVVATRPAAGAEVVEGDRVIVQVSSRVGTFRMPGLVGISTETAQGIIAAYGLAVGEIKRTPSDEPGGSVLVQYPEEGMTVHAGDAVHLIIAGGRGAR